MKPNVLILHATGTNRDHDAAAAIELAGGNPEIVHINQLRAGQRSFNNYQMLVLPGGFSYADALGAGRLLALDLNTYFVDEVLRFVAEGKPVIGICNGFQALVKSGILPDPARLHAPQATLTFNQNGNFECRWVHLQPVSQICIWTRGLKHAFFCPVAHGEGNFTLADPHTLDDLRSNDQIALAYSTPDGTDANGAYPHNPNGSIADIAGICNPQGNVLGLMPHPENHIFAYQRPDSYPFQPDLGLPLFKQGIDYARQL